MAMEKYIMEDVQKQLIWFGYTNRTVETRMVLEWYHRTNVNKAGRDGTEETI